MSKALVKEQFGAAAEAYAVSRVHAQGASLGRLIELVAPQPDWRMLDIATGAGHTAFAFAPHVEEVVASDITPEMLATTLRLAQQRGLSNLRIQEADAEALPFPDASFELVTCRIAPHHFADVAAFLGEARRVLRPGGLFAMVDNTVPGSAGEDVESMAQRSAGDYINSIEKLRDPSHHRCLSVEEWLAAFVAAGFTVVHHETQPKAIEFLDWAVRLNPAADVVPRLRTLLLQAPPAAAAFLQVTPAGDDLHFLLREAILIGRTARPE
jgi:ubiquinone/menaquinone biosynthesis C-methylase UbiE